ncbi:MAG: glycogen debranching N-terminal domain-containing protein [Candidatus Eisenbacteria bacterium]|nr:glycogen debranching N-terminal domain-containing protein [Candidatus Eisenbacteria bacterium]
MARTEEKEEKEQKEEKKEKGEREERQERKQRVLTHGTPSMVSSIADAVVIKQENLFFLTRPDGRVPLRSDHGLGLYFDDCRYLDGYDFEIAGQRAVPLVASAANGSEAVYEMTIPEIGIGKERIEKNSIGIRWERRLDASLPALEDRVEFRCHRGRATILPVRVTFRAGFQDIFIVRGLLSEPRGDLPPMRWEDGKLVRRYRGGDGIERGVAISFDPAPKREGSHSARFDVAIGARRRSSIRIRVQLLEDPRASGPERRDEAVAAAAAGGSHEAAGSGKARGDGSSEGAADRSSEGAGNGKGEDAVAASGTARRRKAAPVRKARASPPQGIPDVSVRIESDSLLLAQVMQRSMRDLRVLRSRIGGEEFIAAGVPWFATLFGRDSLITALQILAYEPEIAEQTLRVLASYQGSKHDEWTDEQPGKILHELRIGELARMGKVPYRPYYGTVDATPLFLILLASHADWTGDLSLFRDLRENVDRAIAWIDGPGDENGDGYLEYESRSKEGLVNQGWKDSGDAIVDARGRLARPPISLVEVQGYVYLARTAIASLFERSGEKRRAEDLRRKAEDLRRRFDRDFWVEEKGIYAMALEKGSAPLAVVSSNPGHALWTGIADPAKALRTIDRLMQPDLYSGFGVRTLSTEETAYNPIGYHLGTVWPHDNSILAAGFCRYGRREQAVEILSGLLRAAMHFPHYELPELFAGFSSQEFQVPVHYPVACHPQAWACGAVPYLLQTTLGLQPEGFERRLRVVRPMLPSFVDRLVVRGVRVAGASVDLRFTRIGGGEAAGGEGGAEGASRAAVETLRVDGDVEVLHEA